MERISRNNYEAYFLDYHEDRLGNEERRLLLAFLEQNPDLYDEFNSFENILLEPAEIKFPDKSELFRTEVSLPDTDEWEYMCIAYMEGDLSAEEARKFESECEAHPEKASVLELYMSTRSVQDESVVFSDRESLKKKAVLIPGWAYRVAAAAAVVALAWIVFSPFADDPAESRLADEGSREIIYIDKISHPSKYEKIASADELPSVVNSRSVSHDKGSVPDRIIPPRELISMEPIRPGIPGKIILKGESLPAPSELFAYRYIPDPSEDEYQTLLAFTGDFMRKRLLGQDPDLVEKSRFTFWELADAGLEKVSELFGTQADIDRQYSESGELQEVSFDSPLVAFNTPVRRRAAAQED